MNRISHSRRLTWKDGYRDILAIHSETSQRLQAALSVPSDGQDLDGLSIPTVLMINARATGLQACGLINDGLCER